MIAIIWSRSKLLLHVGETPLLQAAHLQAHALGGTATSLEVPDLRLASLPDSHAGSLQQSDTHRLFPLVPAADSAGEDPQYMLDLNICAVAMLDIPRKNMD